MPLKQEDLPDLSRQHYNIADSLARKILDRHDFKIIDITAAEDGRLIWSAPKKGQPPLAGLSLLAKVRDLETFRGNERGITRSNVITIARIGGYATREVFDTASERGIQLSVNALTGIHRALEVVHLKMTDAFVPIARPITPEREAVYFLSALGKTLQK